MLLRKFCSLKKTDNGYLIHGDAADVMLVFMSDDVIRIRVSFDRTFEEASYTLVTTAWEDRMDELLGGSLGKLLEERDPALYQRAKEAQSWMLAFPPYTEVGSSD